MAIRFHNQDIAFDFKKKNLHKSWIRRVITAHARIPGTISFIFCSNPSLRQMNLEYLNHDYFTDVITFDYSEGSVISGDVFISIDQVRMNAGIYRESFEEELRRVLIHGVLHLLGFGDATNVEKQQMRKLENDALHLWLKGDGG
ncbi:MAG: rRNA maturation RNase YbeY [Bacteroidales bacterium]